MNEPARMPSAAYGSGSARIGSRRYWLIGILKGGYGNDVYPGSGLQDNRWFASIGAVYKLTREWQLNATVRQDWQIATQPTFTYNATSVLRGVRVQR